MNIAKNMEVIFLAAITMTMATGFATAETSPRRLSAPQVVKVGSDAPMTVITVVGKRLSAAEKAQLVD
jgi:hypothetical protein